MTTKPCQNESQQSRLQRFECKKSVDLHCHILPGVDDGPKSIDDSLALCRMLVADGITDAVATPHQLGRWDGTNDPASIRAATAELQQQLDLAQIPLRVHLGGEVRLDERIPMLLRQDRILTLFDRKQYLLLELPSSLTIDPAMLAPFLAGAGVRTILAHPERYDSLQSNPALAEKWTSQGVLFQVNALSLLGDAGEHAENAAWEWLRHGLVTFVASDAHSVNSRKPRMSEAIDEIVARIDTATARRVCIDNPRRLLDGLDLG